MLLNNASQGGGGTLTVFMHYVVNIWCVRESPDLISVGMCLSQNKKWNVAYINSIHVLLHRHLSGSSLFPNEA